MQEPEIVDFHEGGSELHVSPEELARGAGIPILANREEALTLVTAILAALHEHPESEHIVLELPFEMHSPN